MGEDKNLKISQNKSQLPLVQRKRHVSWPNSWSFSLEQPAATSRKQSTVNPLQNNNNTRVW